jgi:hypothetical protein
MYSLDGLLADEGTEYWQFCFGLPVDPADLKQKIARRKSCGQHLYPCHRARDVRDMTTLVDASWALGPPPGVNARMIETPCRHSSLSSRADGHHPLWTNDSSPSRFSTSR